jgi:hypothetical protein
MTVYLLYEGFFNNREKKERLEHVALTSEDAHAWVHAPFGWRYSRTSIPIKVFRRKNATGNQATRKHRGSVPSEAL